MREKRARRKERPRELKKTERETRRARRGVRLGKERGVVYLLLFSAVPLLPFLFTQIYA